MLNVICLMGRLVADPELKHTPGNIPVCSFRIAVDRNYAPKGEERQADFINVVAWRERAEFIAKYFTKGSMIALEGNLQSRQYEKDGQKRTAYEVVANAVHFAGDKRPQNGTETRSEEPQTASFSSADSGDFQEIESGEDDLPF
jgi:single-strand DNA-binding protein